MVESQTARPLFVDLDGTLIATDLLWESVLLLIKTRPLDALKLPFWLVRGKAYFKRCIAQRVTLDPATLPYRSDVLAYLEAQKREGQRLVLATASEELMARPVAEHLGIFDEVLASDGKLNLKGKNKLAAIQERSGSTGFDYIGDSFADLPVWKSARRAILVQPSQSLLKQANEICVPHTILESPRSTRRGIVKALRPHQWAKNLLLVVPLALAHQVRDPRRVLHVMLALVTFSLAASGVYILNDLMDLAADRKHPTKRNRPFAAGTLSIPTGISMLGGLLGISLLVSAGLLPWAFTGLLALYLLLTTAYSLYFKRKLMLDVLCLAGLYTQRIVAGGAAASVPVSPWLLAFSMFFFLSLAFAKRYAELSRVNAPEKERISGRGYMPGDLELIGNMGPTSGYLSVLVLCLYINSPEVAKLYGRPEALYFICPLLMYWISRIWFLAHREQLHEDPVVFALEDRNSMIAGALAAVVLILASLWK